MKVLLCKTLGLTLFLGGFGLALYLNTAAPLSASQLGPLISESIGLALIGSLGLFLLVVGVELR